MPPRELSALPSFAPPQGFLDQCPTEVRSAPVSITAVSAMIRAWPCPVVAMSEDYSTGSAPAGNKCVANPPSGDDVGTMADRQRARGARSP
jgi:hypothetical protein